MGRYGKGGVFVRETRTYCGDEYMTVDVFPYSAEQEDAVRKPRKRREQVSPPKQRNLNDRNARRYLVQLGNANFGEGDLSVTCTYDRRHLPTTPEAAEKEARNFLNRVKYARKKAGLEPLKYILVSEYGTRRGTNEIIRVHHHIIMNGGLDRDAVENLWRDKRRKGEKQGARKGFCNADRLQPEENGIEALTRYLTKNPNGKKRWSSSKNLRKPERVKNDHKYSRRKLERICSTGEIYNRGFWEKSYPGWTLAGAAEFAVEADPPDELNGWRLYAKLRKITRRW
ncbi:MAG: hypothetical protein LUE89_11225 [Clostridiales bacterium]|nr:hypothetical protein [Clostridiales bacterium]